MEKGRYLSSPVANHPSDLPGGLPVEVWAEILEKYLRKAEWLTLCKISRFFHSIARICLYKQLNFDQRNYIPLASFQGALQAQPELGTLIHDLSLSIYPKHRRSFPPFTLVSKINQLPNLQKLSIRDSAVTVELRDAICSRPRLKVLEFDGCILDGSLLTPRTQDYPRSTVVDLKISTHDFRSSVLPDMWVTSAPAGLRSLYLSIWSAPYCNKILSNIMVSANALEKLVINSVPGCIIQFLISSPRLRHLEIKANIDEHGICSSLPADAIPLLENYGGPTETFPIFLRNRPVHSVQLPYMGHIDESDCVAIFNSLQLSSVPVTNLAFSFGGTPKRCWLSHIPNTTRHLEFSIFDKEDLDEILPLELPHLRHLRTICIVPEWYTRFSKEDILRIAETLPSLREIVILSNQTWCMTELNVWEKFEDGDI